MSTFKKHFVQAANVGLLCALGALAALALVAAYGVPTTVAMP